MSCLVCVFLPRRPRVTEPAARGSRKAPTRQGLATRSCHGDVSGYCAVMTSGMGAAASGRATPPWICIQTAASS